ncbi:dihydrodipicolinate synthase family protein [Desulfitobacterium hafniense]|uniref:dihydrodipicolinate synthase family protein n=1 Tax=Desulfitobacterium hafniense TaxID=49338 RepID=UPI000375E1FA|nr:dihydrodipicolinate synthase family protein [Desulfitobacterium hafniense]
MLKLHGVYAPVPTPFAGGRIAYDKLENNLEYFLSTRLEGIVLMGSNGEFVLLTPKEKEELTKFACAKCKGRKPIIVGTGAETTEETIRLCNMAAEAGADAVLVVTPNYYKGSMSEPVLKKFYLDVADASVAPVILYNMPRNTGINISSQLASELALHGNIIGIKDSSGNLVQISECVAKSPSTFKVFAGSASYLYASLTVGAVGGTLALANVFPNECAKIQELYEKGQLEESLKLQMKLIDSNNACTVKYGIAGLKAAMDMMGLYGGEPRLPLLPLNQGEKDDLKMILKASGFLCQS